MRTRSVILGFAVLTLLLTAGTAQSLSGSNTVFTDDIAPGAVNFSDIHENAVTSSRIAHGAVFSGDIADNSVTGTDINEATIPGFKRVYFANVESNAAVTAGDAISASHTGIGRYIVQFPSALSFSGCAVVGTSPLNFTPTGMVTATTGSSYIDVRVSESVNGTNADRPFSLVVVCP